MENSKKSKKPALARNIIARRKEMGFRSAEKFAEYLDIPYATLRDIEAGLSEGRPKTRRLIARKLNCTEADLVAETPIQTPISGKEMIKAALKEALAEGPLPQNFEHPQVLERLHQDIADLKKENAEIKESLEALTVCLAEFGVEPSVFLQFAAKASPARMALVLAFLLDDARFATAFAASRDFARSLEVLLKAR